MQWDTSLHLPSWVPNNEAVQIEAQVDAWAARLLAVSPPIASSLTA